ncbi:hypothetical protein OK074_2142 [Actinobacteria bacterium OK074]|nr:hypothetical protein OK074_2142 [Actinobacteria bacterium OK074]
MPESALRKALTAIGQALSGIDEDLERHAAGQGNVSSPEQLSEIRNQLTQMASQLSSSQLPPREQRLRGASRVITDSWSSDNPLGSKILEAERLYLKA